MSKAISHFEQDIIAFAATTKYLAVFLDIDFIKENAVLPLHIEPNIRIYDITKEPNTLVFKTYIPLSKKHRLKISPTNKYLVIYGKVVLVVDIETATIVFYDDNLDYEYKHIYWSAPNTLHYWAQSIVSYYEHVAHWINLNTKECDFFAFEGSVNVCDYIQEGTEVYLLIDNLYLHTLTGKRIMSFIMQNMVCMNNSLYIEDEKGLFSKICIMNNSYMPSSVKIYLPIKWSLWSKSKDTYYHISLFTNNMVILHNRQEYAVALADERYAHQIKEVYVAEDNTIFLYRRHMITRANIIDSFKECQHHMYIKHGLPTELIESIGSYLVPMIAYQLFVET